MKFSTIALLSSAAGLVAAQHRHQHRHQQGRHGSPVELRDVTGTTETAAGPTTTVYEMGGKELSWEEVEAGLKDGSLVVVGDTITTVIPSTSTSATPTPSPSSSATSEAAQFYQVKSSTSSSSTSSYVAPTTSSTSTSVAPTTTSTSQAATTSTSAAAASTSSTSSSGSGVDADFPSGELDCSTFPTGYGAIAYDYLGLGGWIGIQETPGYTTTASDIVTIVTGTSGGCTKDSFCSYACPAGYQKSQWPTAQGSTGQSVGGLYCNSAGKLELSRPSYKTLCMAGVGGVTVKNSLSKTVSICRTDYPGTESETVPLAVAAGATEAVCNPSSSTSYTWEGKVTTAQYYINPSGYDVTEACTWGSSGTNIGNWAPLNMGLGQSTSGITYLSLFQNSPTNTDGCLDFSINITGDVSGKCSYSNCKYYLNGVESSTGCTITVTGNAVVELS
ncbi:hypothetical protein BP6252_05213 [Coleophoma cylindrospora]|uniref:SUN-domain-containing protein n=1 Tax=Coleophoma cylindrospora TaxID=1849047 RepID=A0A3D8RT79_9HELO|nr:hypothetical protein BP6252_05213 [Coleophoma cylindrospora]